MKLTIIALFAVGDAPGRRLGGRGGEARGAGRAERDDGDGDGHEDARRDQDAPAAGDGGGVYDLRVGRVSERIEPHLFARGRRACVSKAPRGELFVDFVIFVAQSWPWKGMATMFAA